ncbi:hypothetical protein QQF64_030140 [Cirrhinus molitorella]|uniref:Uncharacterized protein n=1 Tax=Cirrhinus molitorella TaxID=172907 RepID=A0ABR3N2J9_9TELE
MQEDFTPAACDALFPCCSACLLEHLVLSPWGSRHESMLPPEPCHGHCHKQLPNECVLAAGARLLWIFESNLKRFVKMQWKCVNGVQQDCGKEPHEFYESIDRHILCLIEIFQSKRGNVGQLLTSFTTNQGL